jgi:hypothetical protein
MEHFESRRRRVVIPVTDNAGTLAWLEESLSYARDGGPTGVEWLLEAVRAEVLFEIERFEGLSLDGEGERWRR